MKEAKEKEYLIVDKETGEIIGERKISEISGDKKPSSSSKGAIVVIFSACLILVICLIWISSVLSHFTPPVQDPLTLSAEPEPTPAPTSAPTSTPTPSPEPTSTPVPVLMPRYISNGTILLEPSSERLAPLTVSVPEDANYCIVLCPATLTLAESGNLTLEKRLDNMHKDGTRLKDTMAFYVSAGSSVEVTVPLREYYIYYATGKTWYGPEEKFGEDTQFYKCDDTFDFYEDNDGYIGWTLTLYKVSNGNMDTTPISEGEFPAF